MKETDRTDKTDRTDRTETTETKIFKLSEDVLMHVSGGYAPEDDPDGDYRRWDWKNCRESYDCDED